MPDLRELWWIDGSPADGMSRSGLESLALATLGTMTSQLILIRDQRAVMVEDHERLALDVLRLVSPAGAPRAGALAAWISRAVDIFSSSAAIRLDVGFSFGSGPSDPAPTLIAAITAAREPVVANDPCRLVLASHPSVTFPPFAGLPLAVSAERAAHGRSARARGAADVVLHDVAGYAVDLGANTLVLQLPEGLCTPAVALGAVRTPLRDRLVWQGALAEVSIDTGSLDDVALAVLTRWGSVVPVVRLEARVLPDGRAAADRLGEAARGALLSPEGRM